jgi:hypothetical protein
MVWARAGWLLRKLNAPINAQTSRRIRGILGKRGVKGKHEIQKAPPAFFEISLHDLTTKVI